MGAAFSRFPQDFAIFSWKNVSSTDTRAENTPYFARNGITEL
jgi:hypothetical protein